MYTEFKFKITTQDLRGKDKPFEFEIDLKNQEDE